MKIITRLMAQVFLFVSVLVGPGELLPAASSSSSAVTPSRLAGSESGIERVWKALPSHKKLAAYRAIGLTPLRNFPPGLIPLIVSYIACPHTFVLTKQDLLLQSKCVAMTEEAMNAFLGSQRPFLRVEPAISNSDKNALLVIWWCICEKVCGCGQWCIKFRIKINNQETDGQRISYSLTLSPGPYTRYYLPLDSCSERYNFPIREIPLVDPTLDGPVEEAWDTRKALDVCIPDFDPVSKSGTRIEGCVYDRQDNETTSALSSIYRYRATLDEDYAALEEAVRQESHKKISHQNNVKYCDCLKYL